MDDGLNTLRSSQTFEGLITEPEDVLKSPSSTVGSSSSIQSPLIPDRLKNPMPLPQM